MLAATVSGGAPESISDYRLVEGDGVLLWVYRSLRFMGEGIDLDMGFASRKEGRLRNKPHPLRV